MSNDKKILVIDDDPNLVTYMTALLEDNGYVVISAGDGEKGIQKAQTEQPDMVLLDITMPEKSGVRFYREVKENEKLKSIPVVMVTGMREEFENFIKTRRKVPPPDGYFSKPVDKDELLNTIKKLIG